MGSVYLAALIIGLGVQLLQFVVPGGSADSADAPEVGGDGDVDHGDAGHDHDASGHHANAAGAIAVFLSLRFWTYGLMAFGLVGTLLHFPKLANDGTTLVAAVTMGLLSGSLASLTMRAIARSQTSSGGEANEAVGRTGKVLLPVERGKRGKVRVEIRGRLIDLIATTDAERLEPGESIVVEEMRDAIAHVSRTGDLFALRAPE